MQGEGEIQRKKGSLWGRGVAKRGGGRGEISSCLVGFIVRRRGAVLGMREGKNKPNGGKGWGKGAGKPSTY